jgi:hypothetical protein
MIKKIKPVLALLLVLGIMQPTQAGIWDFFKPVQNFVYDHKEAIIIGAIAFIFAGFRGYLDYKADQKKREREAERMKKFNAELNKMLKNIGNNLEKSANNYSDPVKKTPCQNDYSVETMFSKKSLKDRYYEAKKKYAENEFAS